ncbi:Asp23/Gls24 family envelope stress response protein [Pseudonocardia sp. TRM90224]|uniref:Asp23/Gls24 family envelope stress response protein n=1 Tax=Pseudonocardia sp. TRM90224 TaxID=2812678 RepID=UPI001E2AF46A|nr:Asp23/Gls24 family envelope stress response protein [Pseudonocardia sp. TRM90224]
MTATAPAPREAEDRGNLDIHPAVLRKIVEFAADQVPGTLRLERRLAGIDVGEAGASARITTGSGDPYAVDVRLELILQYPAPVREVIEAVRAKVGDELDRIAGHRVRAMQVTVTGLRGAPTVARLTRTPQ